MTMGVALVPSVQNPISLEYQIYPPAIDTLVTGMLVSSGENATQCIAIFMMMPRFCLATKRVRVVWTILVGVDQSCCLADQLC